MQPLHPQLTTFIGRTKELTQLAALLADPDCRLVSVVGSGGIGKTRLALQAAEQARQFRDGVVFVPLQGIDAVDMLPSAIAGALKLVLHKAENTRLQIINFLREKHLLLVMDNFEHLLDDTAFISEVLGAATSVKIIATSRERLNMQEEWTLTLQGLAVPDEQSTDAIESYSAVQLFIQRARQVQTEFAFTPNAEAVKQICQQVEGMPLAIELAVTWLRVMTCQQIAMQMGRGLDFLTSPLRNVPERHRSLRAVFEQSWRLLTIPEQDVLMRLSVFRGGFDQEAAAKVAGATLAVLAGLVDKSLIRVTLTGRYDIHELVRQFAQDKLAEAGETTPTLQRHLGYFVELAEAGEAHAYGREQIAWYDRQETEMDNLRAALAWSLSSKEIESGLRIAAALRWVWEMRGHIREGFGWMEKLLPLSAEISLPVRIKALRHASELAVQIDAETDAIRWSDEAMQLAQTTDDNHIVAWTLCSVAFATYERYDDWGAAMLDESIALFRQLDDPFGLSHALRRMAYVLADCGDRDYGQALIEEALIRDREAGDKNAIAWELLILSDILWQHAPTHDTARIIALLRESLALFREIRDTGGVGHVLHTLGTFERFRQNYADAGEFYREALILLRSVGLPEIDASIFAVAGLGGVAATKGQWQRAARLLGAADAKLIKTVRSSSSAYDSDVALVRAQLGEDAFNKAMAEGQAMRWEHAITYAMQDERETVEVSERRDQGLIEPLSTRELDVLRLMADGLSNPEIAQRLILATGTIKAHTRNIFGKLGVNNRVQAVNRANELRLLENKPSQ